MKELICEAHCLTKAKVALQSVNCDLHGVVETLGSQMILMSRFSDLRIVTTVAIVRKALVDDATDGSDRNLILT